MIRTAEIVLPCRELDETIGFFVERLGFRLKAIFPADDPAVAVIAGHGVRLRLERGVADAPGMLRLGCTDPDRIGSGRRRLIAPNGTRIELVAAEAPPVLPSLDPGFALSLAEEPWHAGRAGRVGVSSHRIAALGNRPETIGRVRQSLSYPA